MPGGLRNVKGLDTYNACYGGTNLPFSTVGWVQSAAWSSGGGVLGSGAQCTLRLSRRHCRGSGYRGIGAAPSAVGCEHGCEEAMVVEPVPVSFIKHAC